MKILSIDTSSEVCSVSILENKKVLKELSLENGNTHSQNLMPLIYQILDETQLNLNDIDLFACDNGPGSFTGIRIGIATIKAFRDVTLKPVIGISSLKALAYNLQNINTDIVCSIIDAKNNNVYCGIFTYENQRIKEMENYKFDNINSILNYFQTEKFLNKKIFFVGNGSIVYKDVIQFQLDKRALFSKDSMQNKLSSISIANAAFDEFNSNSSNFLDIVPLYLKKSSAELTLEERSK